jgi:C-terminal processing protease CtpA/Prc
MNAIALPDPYLPTAPPVTGTTEVIKSYILPGNKTGVMYVSSFGGDYYNFQLGVAASLYSFQQAKVERVIIDVSNNGGEHRLPGRGCAII